MRVVDVAIAEKILCTLLADVEAGEVIIIARDGRPIARLSAAAPSSDQILGYDRGADFWIAEDFDTFVPPGFDEHVS